MIDIRRASTLDAEIVRAIDRASFHEPTVNLDAELGHAWSYLFLARFETEKNDGAFLLAWLVSDELHILSVATRPEFRRRGLGRALLTYAIDFAKGRGARTAILEVRPSNAAALELYAAFGFVTARVRPRSYADNDEDAIEMMLEFPA
ncbi:MAG: GNAT family N-acetyltransferase [Polyangiaceae bacterium]